MRRRYGTQYSGGRQCSLLHLLVCSVRSKSSAYAKFSSTHDGGRWQRLLGRQGAGTESRYVCHRSGGLLGDVGVLTFEFDSDHDRRSAREPRSGKVGAVGGEPLRKLIRLVASIHCPSETLSAFTCEPNLNGRCCAQVTPPDLVVRLPWHDPHIVSRPHVLDHYLVRLSGPVPYVTKDCEMSSKEATPVDRGVSVAARDSPHGSLSKTRGYRTRS